MYVNEMTLQFPKEMKTNIYSINMLMSFLYNIKEKKYSRVIFDFSNTIYFETNILAILSYIIEEFSKKNTQFEFKLKENMKAVSNKNEMHNLFNVYSKDRRALFKLRKVGIRNSRETEDLLIKYLKSISLKEYEKIKILLSELIANLKMHTIYKEGTFAGYHSFKDNYLILSVVNYDITIANQIRRKRNIEFHSDYDAILWSLKKSNSTRYMDETGGLGLYLLRKYLSALQGKFTIISGSCYAEFDKNCYDIKNENEVISLKHFELDSRYEGNVFTLYIPYIVEDISKENINVNVIDQFNISDFLGE